jgi:hypothetical protein
MGRLMGKKDDNKGEIKDNNNDIKNDNKDEIEIKDYKCESKDNNNKDNNNKDNKIEMQIEESKKELENNIRYPLLEYLDCSENPLKSLDGLAEFGNNLEYLSLKNCHLTLKQLNEIIKLQKVETLHLDHNLINQLGELLKILIKFPKLENLSLIGNQCATFSGENAAIINNSNSFYTIALIDSLPTLKILDKLELNLDIYSQLKKFKKEVNKEQFLDQVREFYHGKINKIGNLGELISERRDNDREYISNVSCNLFILIIIFNILI